MFSLEFTPIHFRDWSCQNKDWIESQYRAEFGAPLEKDHRCFDCDGKGSHECDMGHSHDCESCDGEGKTTRTPEDVLEEYGRTLYNAQVKSDREKAFKFLKEQEDAS